MIVERQRGQFSTTPIRHKLRSENGTQQVGQRGNRLARSGPATPLVKLVKALAFGAPSPQDGVTGASGCWGGGVVAGVCPRWRCCWTTNGSRGTGLSKEQIRPLSPSQSTPAPRLHAPHSPASARNRRLHRRPTPYASSRTSKA